MFHFHDTLLLDSVTHLGSFAYSGTCPPSPLQIVPPDSHPN